MKSRYIEPAEVARLREAMPSDHWLVLWVAAETGLRIGDVVELRGDAVRGNNLRYKAKKTGKYGVAKIPAALSRELCKAGKTEYIFPSPRRSGEHITRQAIWHRIKRACVLCGIDPRGVSPHSFRKCFAVDLFKREGLRSVQAALQHDSCITSELYAFSDFTSPQNAFVPLLRGDLPLIVSAVLAMLGLDKPIKA